MSIQPIPSASYLPSPLGWLRLKANAIGLTHLDFVEECGDESSPNDYTELAAKELSAYFAGELEVFTVPLCLQGTHFQLNVWEELQKIPFGTQVSYETIARRLGDVKVIRAAATANGRNPVPIIVPCHRVVGKDGSLTGYSGGLQKKKWLLEWEQRTFQPSLLEVFDQMSY